VVTAWPGLAVAYRTADVAGPEPRWRPCSSGRREIDLHRSMVDTSGADFGIGPRRKELVTSDTDGVED
jgi:hypothetical protein